jgi:CRISPR-associated protein Cst2
MPLANIGISMLITLDLHALNNEGAEGNQLMTRQVQIVDEQGRVHAVNAISGDMIKHGFVSRLQQIALDASLPLCSPCRMLDPNRFAADQAYLASIEDQVKSAGNRGDSTLLGLMIGRCVLDDVAGNLLTGTIGGRNRSVARKSVVEFGWAVARPETARTDSFIHTKYVPEGRGTGSGEGANLGQNLFHRPASSGQYAVVVQAEMFRLGRNDYTLEPVLADDAQRDRGRAVLSALGMTLLTMNGAQRNTQLPHVVTVSGVVTTSPTAATPAPIFSPLADRYDEKIARISEQMSQLPHGSPVTTERFESADQFLAIINRLTAEV